MPQDKDYRKEHLRVKQGAFKQYFFYFDKPYRKIKQSIRANRVIAFDLEEKKRVVLPYNHWKSHHKKAYSTSEAARILNRHRSKLYKWIRDGNIPAPYRVPPNPDQVNKSVMSDGGRYLWSEKDFRNAIDFIESTGKWKDYWPTWDEISAHINEDEVIRFIQDEKTGEFIPVWRAN